MCSVAKMYMMCVCIDVCDRTNSLSLSLMSSQQALELMKKIPKEANDIICMSLIKGVSRANIISHGTLWIQVRERNL